MKRLNYPLAVISLLFAFVVNIKAQDTIFFRIGVNCPGIATVFSSTNSILEGSSYEVGEWQLPQAYSSVQSLYDALVGSNFYLENEAISENIKIDWIVWNIDCTNGGYIVLSNGAKLIFNGYFIVYTRDLQGNWIPYTSNYYFQNSKKAVINLKNSEAFQNFRLSYGIYTSNLQFYYINAAAGYDTTGLQFIIPADTNDVNAYWTVKADHFSNIIGGEKNKILVDVEDNPRGIPLNFELRQNYPNPFNPSTVIEFSIPSRSFVELNVYNLLGMKAAALVKDLKEAGSYKVNFDAAGLSAGVYIYELKSGGLTFSRKMIYLK